MPPISLPPPRCCICKKPIEKGPYTEQGRWFIVAHPACARKKHGYGPEQFDGRIAESSASPPGSQASQQNTEPSIRRDANASDAEAGLGSTGPGEDPSRAGRAGTPPPAHRDGTVSDT